MEQVVCVFCASREDLNPVYPESARTTGKLLAERGMTLMYGGGKVGLMGEAALAVHEHGGKVIGVIPEILLEKEVAYTKADELVVTQSMSERKDILIERSDAYLILAGGFGTLDELVEVITLKQLNVHQKPIHIVNTNGFFDPLLAWFDRVVDQGFAPTTNYYSVFATPEEAIAAL